MSLQQLSERFPLGDFAEAAISTALDVALPVCLEDRAIYLDYLIDHLMAKYDVVNNFDLVLKTHLPASKNILQLVEKEYVRASATYRHPAEMYLSRVDMAEKGGEDILVNLIDAYRIHVDDFFTWVSSYKVNSYFYNDIALNPGLIGARICKQAGVMMNLSGYLNDLLSNREKNIGEFNSGKLHRAELEMTKEDILSIEGSFPDLMSYIRRHND